MALTKIDLFHFDSLTLPAKVAYFDQLNGDDAIVLDNLLVYGNGAWRDLDPIGRYANPSDNEYERLSLVLRRQQKLVQKARDDFYEAKEQLVQQAAPYEEAKQRLDGLIAKVRELEAKLQEIQEQLNQTPEVLQRERLKQNEAEQKQRRQERRQAIQAIEL